MPASVVDRHLFYADPDLDPTFHFDADPDPHPDPTPSFTCRNNIINFTLKVLITAVSSHSFFFLAVGIGAIL